MGTPLITYNTTGGATAGTDIVFTEPCESIDWDRERHVVHHEMDSGRMQTTHKFTEQRVTVVYNYETNAIKTAYETFFTTWAAKGNKFLFWPTASDSSTYYTMTLEDDNLSTRRFAMNIPDRHGWTHTYRVYI